MVAELNPSEAQRKAMRRYLDDNEPMDLDEYLDGLIAAANKVSEGAPVGTIARRPDGAFLAVRANTGLGVRWIIKTGEARAADSAHPYVEDADSWPVIYDPTKPEPCVVCDLPFVCDKCTDPTAQQEPADRYCLAQDPEGDLGCLRPGGHDGDHGRYGIFWPQSPKPRTPRVVDRLGVEHQGSRWRDGTGGVWHWAGAGFGGWSVTSDGLLCGDGYTEVLGDPS